MKKLIAIALMAGLMVGSLGAPADAQKKKKKKPQRTERTAEGSYAAPPLIIAGNCTDSGAIGCVALTTAANESYVMAEVTDAHGQPVYVSVQANTDGDMQDDTTYGFFCGKTAQPLVVASNTELHFWVGITPDPNAAGCAPGAASTGTVTVTFSNLP